MRLSSRLNFKKINFGRLIHSCYFALVLKQYYKDLTNVWQSAWQSKSFMLHFAATMILFGLIGAQSFHFMREWQLRPGQVINDRVLDLMSPRDFSIPIFLLEYSSMALVIVYTLLYPYRFMRGVQMFTIVTFARTVSIYFVPLEPPIGMVALNDPVASFFLHTGDVFVTKDLFFSGHVAALSLFYFISPNKHIKQYVALCGLTVAILIMWQHVHYSLDVLAAPVVSYLTYAFVERLHAQTRLGIEFTEAT